MRLRASIPLVRAGLAEVFPDIRGTVEPMPSVMQALLPSGVGAITLGSRVFVRPDLFDAVAAGDEPKEEGGDEGGSRLRQYNVH